MKILRFAGAFAGIFLLVSPSFAQQPENPACETTFAIATAVAPASTKDPLVEQFVAAADGEEGFTKLIKLAIKFVQYSEPQQRQIVEELLERGQGAPLIVLAGILPDAQKLNLLSTMSERMPEFIVGVLATEKKISPQHRMALLKAAIRNASFGQLSPLFSTVSYSLRPAATQHYSFGMKAFAFTVRAASVFAPGFGKKSAFEKTLLSDEEKEELLGLSLRQDPLSIIMAFTEANITADTPLDAPLEPSDLRKTIVEFAEKFPHLFPKDWVRISTANISRREVALGLIREMYRQSDGSQSDAWISPESALEVICRSVGINYREMSGIEYSNETLQDLYEVALDLQGKIQTPVFEKVAIDPALFRQKKLTDLQEVLLIFKKLLFLKGNTDHAWAEIKHQFALETHGIAPSNLKSLLARAYEETTTALNDVLKENTDGAHNLTLDQFKLLHSRWQSTEDVFTLIARYNANRGWKPEIKVLSKILRAEVEGRFEELKKSGHPSDPADQIKAAAQTAMLNTPEKQAAWWNQWTKLALFEAPSNPRANVEAEHAAKVVSDVKKTLSTDLATALSPGREADRSAEIFGAMLESKEPVQKVLNDLGAQEPKQASALAWTIVEQSQAPGVSANDLRKALAYLKSLAKQTPSILNAEEGSATRFSSITKAIFSQLKEVSEDIHQHGVEVIVTTTSTAPRILLSLGSLVDAGSCMNPTTGARADVIPSVALDANIQAIFSTALNWDHFGSARDFTTLVAWLKKQDQVLASFEGGQGVFTFKNAATGASVSSKPISSAYHRHQLKLGATKKGLPGIRTERNFTQDHPALPIMKQQVTQIKKEMARAMGGEVDVEINVPVTRNMPGGTFSDNLHMKTGSGLAKKPYTMPK